MIRITGWLLLIVVSSFLSYKTDVIEGAVRDLDWVKRPAMTAIYKKQICYSWNVRHTFDTHQIRVCRRVPEILGSDRY